MTTEAATTGSPSAQEAPSRPQGRSRRGRSSRTKAAASTTPTTAGTTVSSKLLADAAKEGATSSLMERVGGYLDGAVDTLGTAAAEGNSVAAKAIVDLWAALRQQELGDQANPHLEQIARIRGDHSES